MDRDNITRSGARAPGVERRRPLARRCTSAPRPLDLERGYVVTGSEVHEGRMQTARREELVIDGKAPPAKPALKPYWGKPAVRDFRGSGGNVGIIRSPVRAIALPDNRHEAEEEEALQERSSDPLGLESCAATARDPAKRRQRIGGVGIQLRKL